MRRHLAFIAFTALAALSCQSGIARSTYDGPLRSFETSFESEADFSGFYMVPPGEYDSSHGLTDERAIDGPRSHKAWILKARDVDNDGSVYLPHRAYPTIQLQKTEGGVYRSPCLVTLYAFLDISLQDRPQGSIDDWFSFITLSPDTSDGWVRTVLANLTPDGYLKLVHVPTQGAQDRIYQADSANDPGGSLAYPLRSWTRIDLLIDFSETGGYAKLWQNKSLVSSARVEGGKGALAQAHFGLYASAAIPSGVVYNDKLRIREVADEAEALALIESE